MITAQEARTNSESLDITEYTNYLHNCITKASTEGADHIKLIHRPYNEIGSPNARPAMRKITEKLVSLGYKIKYNKAVSQLDTASVEISWSL